MFITFVLLIKIQKILLLLNLYGFYLFQTQNSFLDTPLHRCLITLKYLLLLFIVFIMHHFFILYTF